MKEPQKHRSWSDLCCYHQLRRRPLKETENESAAEQRWFFLTVEDGVNSKAPLKLPAALVPFAPNGIKLKLPLLVLVVAQGNDRSCDKGAAFTDIEPSIEPTAPPKAAKPPSDFTGPGASETGGGRVLESGATMLGVGVEGTSDAGCVAAAGGKAGGEMCE